jgi:hypothetical protein
LTPCNRAMSRPGAHWQGVVAPARGTEQTKPQQVRVAASAGHETTVEGKASQVHAASSPLADRVDSGARGGSLRDGRGQPDGDRQSRRAERRGSPGWTIHASPGWRIVQALPSEPGSGQPGGGNTDMLSVAAVSARDAWATGDICPPQRPVVTAACPPRVAKPSRWACCPGAGGASSGWAAANAEQRGLLLRYFP